MHFLIAAIITCFLYPVNFIYASELELGGSINYIFGSVNEKSGYNIIDGTVNVNGYGDPTNTEIAHKRNMSNEADVVLHYNTDITKYTKVGGFAGLRVNAKATESSLYDAPRSYLYLEGKLGRFEFGSNYSAAETLDRDARRVAVGTGGIGGSWHKFANIETGVAYSTLKQFSLANQLSSQEFFLIFPDLIESLTHLRGIESSRKLTYYTPKVYGLQAGVSIIKNSFSTGDRSTFFGDQSLGNCCAGQVQTMRANIANLPKDLVAGGLTFESHYKDIGIVSSLTGNYQLMKKGPEQAFVNKLVESKIAAALNWSHYEVAASYQDSGASLKNKRTASEHKKATSGYTVGLGYKEGPFAASVTFFGSRADGNRFYNWSVATNFNYVPYTTQFIELTYFEFQPRYKYQVDTPYPSRNKGNVLMFGSFLKF